jgi:hypothetical protein
MKISDDNNADKIEKKNSMLEDDKTVQANGK